MPAAPKACMQPVPILGLNGFDGFIGHHRSQPMSRETGRTPAGNALARTTASRQPQVAQAGTLVRRRRHRTRCASR
jgi:hypothetical protein